MYPNYSVTNVYEINDITGIKGYLKAFLLAILLIISISFVIIIPVFGSRILLSFKQFNIFPNLSDNILRLYEVFKWPISMLVIFINLKIKAL